MNQRIEDLTLGVELSKERLSKRNEELILAQKEGDLEMERLEAIEESLKWMENKRWHHPARMEFSPR